MTNPTNSSPTDGAGAAGVTADALLGGRVRLLQPSSGLRAAIDPVFLAAAVPARSGETVLEVGCGTGAAALCLAARCPAVRVVGLDLQEDLIGLANRSAQLNGVSDRVMFVSGDLLAPPQSVASVPFDHAMANPPFARAGSGRVSPDPSKALASVEGAADLAAWVSFCARRVRPGGSVTFVHRTDRAAEVAALFAKSGLDARVLPLGDKRVLVQGRAGSGAVTYLPEFALHGPAGAFTPGAEAILRDAAPLILPAP